MAEHTALGEPRALDAYLQPTLRLIAWVVGGTGSVSAFAFGSWWWGPVPLAVALLGYELWRWQRSDRPIVLELGPDLRLVDARGGQTLRVSLADVTCATCWHRGRDSGREVVIALYSDTSPLLALSFRLAAYAPHPLDVDGDRWDTALGGLAAIVRAAAPAQRACRQWFTDPIALAWIRANVPDAAWGRTAARAWSGVAPPLDLFGFLEGDSDRFVVLDDAGWATAGGPGGALSPVAIGSSSRDAVLFRLDGDRPDEEAGRLPLLIVGVPGLELALPCPAGVDAPAVDGSAERLHVQLPEAAALLAHLERAVPGLVLPLSGAHVPANPHAG
ncbi:MAG: hypothetical protein ACI8PZ_004124 [Myxococcota bacterium]|jgi:hypothetical protein